MIRTCLGLAATVTMLAVGCGNATSDGNVVVRGTVSPTARRLDNARAIAMTSTGKTYWAYVDARGSFAVKVPAGQAYRLVISNQRATGGQRVIGHLMVHTSKGASRWMALGAPGTITLGTLGLGAAGTTTRPMSEGETSSSDSSDGGELDTHDDDGERGDLCTEHDGDREDDDVELDSDSDPGDSVRDDREADHDREDGDDDAKACAPAAQPPGSPPPPVTTTQPPGGSCGVNAQCGTGLGCVASKCVPSIR